MGWLLLVALASVTCVGCRRERASGGAPTSASASAAPAASSAPSAPPRALVHEGSTIARSPDDAALWVAAEDLRQLLRVPLPLDASSRPSATPLPGAPSQVLALAGRVLVVVRDPGLLLAFDVSPSGALTESLRVALPVDAWGLAVTPDEQRALVTSAWAHRLSAIDLASQRLLWSIDVPREPRGVVVLPDASRAYVSHLTGSGLTRVDLGSAPVPVAVPLPPAPVFFLPAHASDASLGYALALSPDGRRLFAPRHALGASERSWWYGTATIDVLLTGPETPLAPTRAGPGLTVVTSMDPNQPNPSTEGAGPLAPGGPFVLEQPLVQPRAVAWRPGKSSLLITGEGSDTLVEYDALALEPALAPIRVHRLAAQIDAITPVPASGGAPSGVALSADGAVAYVHCRSTFEVVAVTLDGPATKDPTWPRIRLADDPAPALAALGRRAFYDATDAIVSGGLGCAGCHPDGRDDGHVWHLARDRFFAEAQLIPRGEGAETTVRGVARQTPTLAGRLASAGPFGWHAQSRNLAERVVEGFHLHRSGELSARDEGRERHHAQALVEFLPRLAPPPREERPLDDQETRGRELFLSREAGCSGCHQPNSRYADNAVHPIPEARSPRFDVDPLTAFRTPPLLFVGGTAPYYHDGPARSLEELIEKNGTRMGDTSHLGPRDRAALVAFLRTL